jgi:hypothetical protein
MALAWKEHRHQLIARILAANSTDEVEREIDAGISMLRERKVNGHIVNRMLAKIMKDLNGHLLTQLDDHRVRNLLAARMFLSRMKRGGSDLPA